MYYKLTIASYVGLLGLLVLWYGAIDPPVHTLSLIVTVIFIALLLLPAKGLLGNNPKVYMWSSYLILIYFSHAIIESWANNEFRLYAIAELLLSCGYFVFATMCHREYRKK